MKTIIIFALALTWAYADDVSPIVQQEFNMDPDGRNFNSIWETSDGTRVESIGHEETVDGVAAINIDGSVKYVGSDGPVSWTYKAGPQGYVAVGDIIPTPPPTPDYIQRLLDFLATKPPIPEKV